MKQFPTYLFVALLLGSAGILWAQSGNQQKSANVPAPTPYAITKQDGNSRVWERTIYEESPSGQIIPKKHSYTELATGLNHLVGNQWVPSQEEITILPDGTAAATQGQHKVYFPADIYNGQIKLVTPDGQILQSQPTALSYDDGSNTVLIAILTNSIGQLVDSNQIIYPNAFMGLNADLRYTYRKSGFEQDVVLHEQPLAPADLGLNPETTKIEVLTEFFNAPTPKITRQIFSNKLGLPTENENLDFGKMTMVPGKAFSFGRESKPTRVGKSWINLEGRRFLLEQVTTAQIAEELEALPAPATQTRLGKPISTLAKSHVAPPQHLVKTATPDEAIRLAKITQQSQKGFVLDYVATTGSYNDFVFQGDTTYLISGTVNFNGLLTIEGGAVIKFVTAPSAGATVQTWAGVNCKTSAYRPAIFTSQNDNTVGEGVSNLSNPLYYGTAFNVNQPSSVIENLRFLYANTGLHLNDYYFEVRDCQFVNCTNGIQTEFTSIDLNNGLFYKVKTPFSGALYGVSANYITIDGSSTMTTDWYNPAYSSVRITNSLLVAITNWGSVPITTNNTPFLSSGSGVFQIAGAGSHYLATNSPYHNIGTTNVAASLLDDLASKTTCPPIVYSNITLSVSTTNFSLQAQRDNDGMLDLGYHYDPVDYFFGGVHASTNLTFTAGAVMGWFELPGNGGPGYGISLPNYVSATFNGTVTSPCVEARYDTVQEGGNGSWTDKGWLGGIIGAGADSSTSAASLINAKFTDFALLSTDPNNVRDYNAALVFRAMHCEFWSGQEGGYVTSFFYTNCLFDRHSIQQVAGQSGNVVAIVNSTFHGGLIYMTTSYPFPISVLNCALDGTTATCTGYAANSSYATYDYNAYTNASNPFPLSGSHNVPVTGSFNWQSSWFGDFYLPTNSTLINAGNATADQLGLYHFTTQTNQVIEANSQVDIGYHYVGTDAYGAPLDSNDDDVPDYLEDANGNGLNDIGETIWSMAILTQPLSQSVIQSSNVMFNVNVIGVPPFSYQWRFFGTNLPGATGAFLIVSNVQIMNAGNYSVVASDPAGSLVSSNALLTVLVPPTILQQPTNLTLNPGDNATFGVTLNTNSSAPLQYQWYLNGVNLLGATNVTLSIINVQAANAGNYYVVATNAAGSVASSNATLLLSGPPIIYVQPTNQIVVSSGNLTFTVQATGTTPLNYQWMKNGLVITNSGTVSGANSNVVTLTGLKPWDQGLYSVTVSNSLGRIASHYAIKIITPSVAIGWNDDTYGQIAGLNKLANVAAVAIPNYYGLALGAGGNVFAAGQMEGYEYVTATLNGLLGNYSSGDAIAPGAALMRNNKICGCILSATDRDGNQITTWPGQYNGPTTFVFQPADLNVTSVLGSPLRFETASGTEIAHGVVTSASYDGTQTTVVLNTLDFSDESAVTLPIYVHDNYDGGVVFHVASVSPSILPPAFLPKFNLTLNQNFTGKIGDILQVGNVLMTVTTNSGNIVTCDMPNDNAKGQLIPFMSSVSAQILTNNSASGSLIPVAIYPLNDGILPTPSANFSYPIASSMLFPNSSISAGGIVPSPQTNAIQTGTIVQVSNPGGSGVSGSGDLLFVNSVGTANNNTGYPYIPTDATNVVAITTSPNSLNYGDFALALKNNGTVESWDLTGALDVPANLTNAVAVAAGDLHSLALKNDGRVLAWGNNTYGQTNVPLNLTNAIAIAASTYYSLALRSNGTVVAWGYNIQTNVPARVTNVVAISAGYRHGLALKSDSTVIAWNTWSNNPTIVTNVPSGLTNVVAISAGNGYSLALKNNGTVVAWGDNTYGQTNIPSTWTNVFAIAAGNHDSAALVIPQAPIIIQQPTNYIAIAHGNAYFTVSATSLAPLNYQWLFNGNLLAWATNASLVLSNVQAGNAGAYSVTVSNLAGGIASSSASLTVLLPPSIIQQPTNYAVAVNGSALFSITIGSSSATPLGYQWLFNGINLVGATNGSLSLGAVQTNNAGIYSVIVTNIAGSATSQNATLTILPPSSWFQQYWGVGYGSNPNANPYADPDGDGMSNIGEYMAGTNPTNFDQAMLGCWQFDTTNWAGNQGQLPLIQAGLASALSPGIETNAVDMNGFVGSKQLVYQNIEVNGNRNITLQSGSVIFWFKPSWSGINEGGAGPGNYGRLISIGDWTLGATEGAWMVNLDPNGDAISLNAQDNAGHQALLPYVAIPGGMQTNQWVQFAIIYTSTNTAFYIDGTLAGTNSGLNNIMPPPNVLTNGFDIGTDPLKGEAAQGTFDLLQTFNYPLTATAIQSNFQAAFTQYPDADPDGDGIPNFWESILGLNPIINDSAQPSDRANYSYTHADWLNQISGVRTGTISLDNEGNVLQVSQ